MCIPRLMTYLVPSFFSVTLLNYTLIVLIILHLNISIIIKMLVPIKVCGIIFKNRF